MFKKKKADALRDRPPAMFVGDKEPGAAPLVPRPADQPLPEGNDPPTSTANDHASSGPGCAFYFAVMLAIAALHDEIGLSRQMGHVVFFSAPVITLALYLWNTLRDEDVARADLTSGTPLAAVRRWLRRVLRMRVG